MHDILKGSDLSTYDGQLKAGQEITKVNPQMGMDFMKETSSAQIQKYQVQQQQMELMSSKMDIMASIALPLKEEHDDLIKSGKNEAEVKAAMMPHLISAIQNLEGQTLPNGAPLLDDRERKVLESNLAGGYNSGYIDQVVMHSVRARDAIKLQLAERKQDTSERAEASKEKYYENLEKIHQLSEQTRARREDANQRAARAPSGYEWDPNNPDRLRPIAGGPKDAEGKPWTGREKVYTERILGSANQAATAIKNITELPVSASTGVLGIGGHAGGSLFNSTFGALKNELSSQETQDYNVMLAGVKRNLASIETMGLSPAGSLTESMSSLEMRPGDSHMTKLRKLAEMRQIVEKGMDVPLADPAIPPEIKSVAANVVNTGKEAVPYTQADVTRLQRIGTKNPDMTLEQLIGKQGLNRSSKGGTAVPDDIAAILKKHGAGGVNGDGQGGLPPGWSVEVH